MPNDISNPKIAFALGVRRQIITHLEQISPNVEMLDIEPQTLSVRLAATLREAARLCMSAVHALEEPDEETEG